MAGNTVQIQLVRTEDGHYAARLERDIAVDQDLQPAQLREIALAFLDAALMLDKLEDGEESWPTDTDGQH